MLTKEYCQFLAVICSLFLFSPSVSTLNGWNQLHAWSVNRQVRLIEGTVDCKTEFAALHTLACRDKWIPMTLMKLLDWMPVTTPVIVVFNTFFRLYSHLHIEIQ